MNWGSGARATARVAVRGAALVAVLAVATTSRAESPPEPVRIDRVVVRFFAPETGGSAQPRFVTERTLAFEARLEAMADRPDGIGEGYDDRRIPRRAGSPRRGRDARQPCPQADDRRASERRTQRSAHRGAPRRPPRRAVRAARGPGPRGRRGGRRADRRGRDRRHVPAAGARRLVHRPRRGPHPASERRAAPRGLSHRGAPLPGSPLRPSARAALALVRVRTLAGVRELVPAGRPLAPEGAGHAVGLYD